jgi:hypothetical protein
VGRAVLADDGTRWIAAYGVAENHAGVGVRAHVRFSTNEGATWTAEDTWTNGSPVGGDPFTPHAPNTVAGEPLLFVAPNGDIILQVNENGGALIGAFQYRSTDGGATWTDEGQINSDPYFRTGQDYTIVGTDIYLVVLKTVNLTGDYPYTVHVYKSTDNAATWVDLATVESSTLHSNEAGIAHVGGSNFIVVKREGDATAVTHIYYSSDNCVTWTARAAIPIMGELERPRLLELDNGVLLFGRDQLGASVSDYTVVWYSADGGLTWGRKFYPDTTAFSDCGYCDVLQRADGKFYMLTYGGTTLTASVRSCVFEIA